MRHLFGGSVTAGILLPATPAFAQYYANDFTPPSAISGKLTGAASGKQVGGSGNGHAVLLTGNALTSVDLHPLGYSNSIAEATDDLEQWGDAYAPASGGSHAIKWSGSAASYVDLHSLFTWTHCTGI